MRRTKAGSAPLRDDATPADPGSEGLPLEGVRVVDLTFNIAGPYASMILGDLGADVTKIEPPGLGDDARRMAPVHGSTSAYFLAINRNKRSSPLDVGSSEHAERLHGMLASADVFVTNLRAGSLERLGLAWEALRSRYPRLIYADISGYGASGPECDRPGYDGVLQARSGLMSVTGEPGRAPTRVGVSILDMGSGIWLALGVLAALRSRDRSRRGSRVSTSLLEVGAAFMGYDTVSHQLTGRVPEPRGSGHPAFAPYGAFRAADGYLVIGAGADHVFDRLCRAIGADGWTREPELATNAARVANRERLRERLEAILADRPVRDCVRLLTDAGVPAEPVSDVHALLEDPQLEAVELFLDLQDAEGSPPLRVPGLPLTFDGRRPPLRFAPPAAPSPGTAPVRRR